MQSPHRGPRGAGAVSGLWVSSFAGPPRAVTLTPAPRGPSPPGRVFSPRHCLPALVTAAVENGVVPVAGGEEDRSRLPCTLALRLPVLCHGGGERV